MKNFLNSVKVLKPRTNTFDLTHDVKLSGNMGQLIPIMAMDCVPGDSVSLSCAALIRMAPLVAPMMHRVNVYMHYFFVPNRILWDNWGNFITNTKVSGSVPAAPTVYLDTVNIGLYSKLLDYMGFPVDVAGVNNNYVSALPFAAYQAIYNEYYRDQNMVPEVDYKLTDGVNASNVAQLLTLRKRAWEHDYFTSALPFAQKGDAVEIPISGLVTPIHGETPIITNTDGTFAAMSQTLKASNPTPFLGYDAGGPIIPQQINPNGSLEVANADTTINDLRKAYALQRFLEKLARGGSRLTEFIRTMFGVTSSDARLQRPEYITGSVSPVVISEVLNTTGTVDAPQGAMAGHGAAVSSGNYGHFFCEEHGYIIGIMSVMPRTAYQQGIPKHMLKINNSYEYFTPDFANIGEQTIENREVYAKHSNPTGTFGYIPRYGEYKFMQNRTAGDFRTTLNFWTMTRIFATDANLNQQFIECDPTFRTFAVTDPAVDHLWCHVENKVIAKRLMPKYGTPTF